MDVSPFFGLSVEEQQVLHNALQIKNFTRSTGALSLSQCLFAAGLAKDRAEDGEYANRLKHLIAAYYAQEGYHLEPLSEDSKCNRAVSLHLQ